MLCFKYLIKRAPRAPARRCCRPCARFAPVISVRPAAKATRERPENERGQKAEDTAQRGITRGTRVSRKKGLDWLWLSPPPPPPFLPSLSQLPRSLFRSRKSRECDCETEIEFVGAGVSDTKRGRTPHPHLYRKFQMDQDPKTFERQACSVRCESIDS